MARLELYIAQPTAPPPVDQPQPVTIRIDRPLPDFQRCDLDDVNAFYDGQADALVDALYHALPQGTFDRVALKMFAKKLSLYRGVTNS